MQIKQFITLLQLLQLSQLLQVLHSYMNSSGQWLWTFWVVLHQVLPVFQVSVLDLTPGPLQERKIKWRTFSIEILQE